MTLSRDERAARAEQLHKDRRARREATNARHPWLVPVVIVVAIAVLATAVVLPSMLGVPFF